MLAKGSLSISNAGLAIFSVLQIGPLFGFLIMTLTDMDNAMNAVERLDASEKVRR